MKIYFLKIIFFLTLFSTTAFTQSFSTKISQEIKIVKYDTIFSQNKFREDFSGLEAKDDFDFSGRYVGRSGDTYYELAIYKNNIGEYEGIDIFITKLNSYVKSRVHGKVINGELIYFRNGLIDRKLLKGGVNGEDLINQDAGDIVFCSEIKISLNLEKEDTKVKLLGIKTVSCGENGSWQNQVNLEKEKNDIVFINPNNQTIWNTTDLALINWNQSFPPGKITLELLENGINKGAIVENIYRNSSGGYFWKISDTLKTGNNYQIKLFNIRKDGSEREFVSISNYFSIKNFKNGLTLVTHGFQLFGFDDLENWTIRKNQEKGQISFCEAIKKRVEIEGDNASIYVNDPINIGKWKLISGEGKDTDEIILFYNWSKLSNDGLISRDDGELEASADYLFTLLVNPSIEGKGKIPLNLLNSQIPFHFIGHSRGAILLTQLLFRIAKFFPSRKIEHVTFLDPHPARPMGDLNKDNENYSLPGVYGLASDYPSEKLRLKPLFNVERCDNYFRQSIYYESKWPTYDLTDFSGIYVEGANNRILIHDDLEKGSTPISTLGIPLLQTAHTAVPEWYIGTILPNDAMFDTEKRKNWYYLKRDRFGFNQSRIGGNLDELKFQNSFANLSEFEVRSINRSGHRLNSIYNQNFTFGTNGWLSYGGRVNPVNLIFKKKSVLFKNNVPPLLPSIKHNNVYFNNSDSFVGIKVGNTKQGNKLNFIFQNQIGILGEFTLEVSVPDTYFIKIPEELKGNVGSFEVGLDKTSTYYPTEINEIFTTLTSVKSNDLINLQWRNKETSLTPIVKGVVADGTSRILISIGTNEISPLFNVNQASKIQVGLKDKTGKQNNSNYIGSIRPILNQTQFFDPLSVKFYNEITAISDFRKDNIFYFDYQAPIDFVREYNVVEDLSANSREIEMEIVLLDFGNNQIGEKIIKTISVVRPPLILAHGLGGEGIGKEPKDADESTWRKFRYLSSTGKEVLFRESELFLVKREINLLPTSSFDDNSDVLLNKNTNLQLESFDTQIKQMNDLGYACAKVDYIAHSMGGSVLRNTLEKPEFKNPKNYNQGYVNKFITICTPHQGSPLGDIMSEFSPYLSISNEAFLSFLTPNLTGFLDGYFKGNPQAVEAVKNLSIRKENGGIKFGSADIKNHQIVGNYVNKFKYDYGKLFGSLWKDLKIGTSALDHMTLAMALAAVRKFDKCNCTKEKNEVISIIQKNTAWRQGILPSQIAIFEKYILKGDYLPNNIIIPTSNLIPEFYNWASRRIYNAGPEFYNYSDMVVSVESQTSGKIKTLENSQNLENKSSISVFNDITHNFNPKKATQNPEVGNRVFELLNKSVNSPYFDSNLPASPEISSTYSCSDNCSILFVNPIENFSVFPNPANSIFALDLHNVSLSANYSINIIDSQGTVVKTIHFENECCPKINSENIQPGSYNVILTDQVKSYSTKIIINK